MGAKGYGGVRAGFRDAEKEGVGISPGAHPERDPDYGKTNVGSPGNRPLTTKENQAAIEAEIKRINPRAQTGSDAASRRREGALRRN